jgi:hypothetical protein
VPGPKRRWTNEQIAEAISVSTSWSQVASRIGLAGATGSSFTTMKRVAAELGLDTGHFEAIAWNKGTGGPRSAGSARRQAALVPGQPPRVPGA